MARAGSSGAMTLIRGVWSRWLPRNSATRSRQTAGRSQSDSLRGSSSWNVLEEAVWQSLRARFPQAQVLDPGACDEIWSAQESPTANAALASKYNHEKRGQVCVRRGARAAGAFRGRLYASARRNRTRAGVQTRCCCCLPDAVDANTPGSAGVAGRRQRRRPPPATDS